MLGDKGRGGGESGAEGVEDYACVTTSLLCSYCCYCRLEVVIFVIIIVVVAVHTTSPSPFCVWLQIRTLHKQFQNLTPLHETRSR